MKNLTYRSLVTTAAILVAGGTSVIAADLTPRYRGGNEPAWVALRQDDATSVTPPAPHVYYDATPATPAAPQVLAQAPAAPPQVYYDPGQLARIDSEIEKLKADMKKTVKTPDTKKGWSSPKIGGRIFINSVNYADQNAMSRTAVAAANSTAPNGNGNLQNSLGISDARIAVSGTGYDTFDYKLELGFSSASQVPTGTGEVGFRDVWFGAKKVPLLGDFRVGNFRPETTMSYYTSPTVIPTLNGVGAGNAFAHGRRLGVSSTHFACDQKMRFMVSVFQGGEITTMRTITNDNQSTLFNTRFTTTPIYEQEGKYLFHVGGNYSHQSPTAAGNSGSSINIRQAALATQTNASMITTGTATDGSVHQGALEFITQYKSLGLAGEFYVRNVIRESRNNGRSGTATGAWLEGRWVVTGESRKYDRENGVIGALVPKKNFHPISKNGLNLLDGLGALELVTQWSYADLTDWRGVTTGAAGTPVNALIKSGQLNELTFSSNWVWAQNVRWITQYTRSWQDLCANPSIATTDMIGCGLHMNW